MNDQFPFPGLIPGNSNRFARAACQAIVNQPGRIYNPLWLYGPSGTGKTTLLRAALEQIRIHHPQLRIGSIQAEEYVRKLVFATRRDTQEEFHRWFSDLDVLAVDHLDLLRGKCATQVELAKILINLANRGCQVILVSADPPQMLEELHRILRDHCEWFLMADIVEPEEEERLCVIAQTAQELELSLPDPLIQRILRDTRTHCHIRFILNQLAIRRQLLGADAGSPAEILDTLLKRTVLI